MAAPAPQSFDFDDFYGKPGAHSNQAAAGGPAFVPEQTPKDAAATPNDRHPLKSPNNNTDGGTTDGGTTAGGTTGGVSEPEDHYEFIGAKATHKPKESMPPEVFGDESDVKSPATRDAAKSGDKSPSGVSPKTKTKDTPQKQKGGPWSKKKQAIVICSATAVIWVLVVATIVGLLMATKRI